MHFIGVEPFARIAVKAYVELIVNTFHVLERERLKPLEKLVRLPVAALDKAEIFPSFGLHTLVRLLVKAHVKLVYGVNTTLLHGRPVAPLLIRANELAELRAVIA